MTKFIDLGGWWNIHFDEENSGEKKKWMAHTPPDCKRINLPSCWNEVFPDHYHYDGPAWYFRDQYFTSEEIKGHNHLYFEGVNYRCSVWINSRICGEHEGGFTSFSFPVDEMLIPDSVNHFAVRVDSKLDTTTIPPSGVDWFNFGGIYRRFGIRTTGSASIADYRVKTRMNGEVSIETDIVFDSDISDLFLEALLIDQDGNTAAEGKVRSEISSLGKTTSELKLDVKFPHLWNVGKPYLYTLRLILSRNKVVFDTAEKKIGIREFMIQGNKLLVNGREVRLVGCAKHEDYPMTGRTVTREQLVKDYDLLRHMNANFVRLSHYPHNQLELDLLDELGMLAIAEAPIVFLKAKQMNDPKIQEKCKKMLDEMIHDEKNATCIMFWSLFIECETFLPEARTCVETLVNYTKKLDDTRLVIMASNRPRKDNSYDLFDVVGVNYWSGWYGGEDTDSGDHFFEWMTKKYPDKPMLITSHGWEGLYGNHSREEKTPWSEESQAEYLSNIADVYTNYKNIKGEIIWTFSDFRVSDWNDISTTGNDKIYLGRPMLLNHKGVVDHERNPKTSYYTMQKKFAEWQQIIPELSEDKSLDIVDCNDLSLSNKAAAFSFIDCINSTLQHQEKVRVLLTWRPVMKKFFEVLAKNQPLVPWEKIEIFQFEEIINSDSKMPFPISSKLRSWFESSEIIPRLLELVDSSMKAGKLDNQYSEIINKKNFDLACVAVGAEGEIGLLDAGHVQTDSNESVIQFEPSQAQIRNLESEKLFPSKDGQALCLSILPLYKTEKIFCFLPEEMNPAVRSDLIKGKNADDIPAGLLNKHSHAVFFLPHKNLCD